MKYGFYTYLTKKNISNLPKCFKYYLMICTLLKELEMRRETLSFSMDVAAAKWRAAKSENELIYHEVVIPVLSDEDDDECLGKNSSSTSNSQRRRLERVKGASLVKPIGFGVDDPELMTTVVTTTNNESPNVTTTITTTLFRDLVPAATRLRADIYRFVLHLFCTTLLFFFY